MLSIRLRRIGRKGQPSYELISIDSRFCRNSSRYKEKIGYYHPTLRDDNPRRFKIDLNKYNYLLSVGAQPTERIQKLVKSCHQGRES